MRFLREIGKCNCGDTKTIIKEIKNDKVRFFYEKEWDSVLLLCRCCNAKIRDTFKVNQDDKIP